MINFHPSANDLQRFSAGTCQPAEALMISAHVDMCTKCQSACQEYQIQLSEEVFDSVQNLAPLDESYNQMLSGITDLPAIKTIAPKKVQQSIELDGKTFQLPRTLRRYVSSTGNWSRLVGKVWQAPIDLGDMGNAHFIYMENGGRVPEHTHRGSEITLVIDGQYSDGISDYDCGDFTKMNNQHKHQPYSESHDGCLVLSIVDKPLHFTSGIARLLNPFSHLFFK